MLAQTPRIESYVSSSEKLNTQLIQSDNPLLQRVLESFVDGILILTEQGELVQANDLAYQICTQFPQEEQQPKLVPKKIWLVCQFLRESHHSYANQSVVVESEITIDKSTLLRIRVRWFALNANTAPWILVFLEDRYQSIQNLAIAEVDQYSLTPREADVWLLRRADYSTKEIAAELRISLNTVKKHLKNIQAKRETFLDKQ